jgi:hypothetical protein
MVLCKLRFARLLGVISLSLSITVSILSCAGPSYERISPQEFVRYSEMADRDFARHIIVFGSGIFGDFIVGGKTVNVVLSRDDYNRAMELMGH